MIYLLVFTFSVLFTYLAQRTVNQRLFFFSFSVMAVLFPSMLAGFRDSGVGTDTLVYVDDIWGKITRCDNWKLFWISYIVKVFDDVELLYLFVNYVVFQLGGDLHALYFTVNFIVVLLFYLAAYDNRKKAPMWLVMTLFLLMYYNVSLNLVRQSIALSMCVYAFKYAESRNWKRLILWCVLIILAHNTGVFYVIFLVFFFTSKIQVAKLKNMLLFSFYLSICLFLIAFDYILSLAISFNVLPVKFGAYLSESSEVNIQKASFFLYFSLLLLFYAIKKVTQRYIDVHKEISFYTSTKCIGLFLFITSLMSKWAFRISYYFNYICDCIFLPRALYILKGKSRKAYIISVVCLLFICILMWFWTIIYRNENETYPYKSRILGIY
jgi:hypothetical protein